MVKNKNKRNPGSIPISIVLLISRRNVSWGGGGEFKCESDPNIECFVTSKCWFWPRYKVMFKLLATFLAILHFLSRIKSEVI